MSEMVYEDINSLSKYELVIPANKLEEVIRGMKAILPPIKGIQRSTYMEAKWTDPDEGRYFYEIWLTEEQAIILKLRYPIKLTFMYCI